MVVIDPDQHRQRIAAALRGALAAQRDSSAPGSAAEMLGMSESLAAMGSLDIDDLRTRHLLGAPPAGPLGMVARVLPFGLATPAARPRLRRDAYRCAAAAGADEGTAIGCVAAALVAADLLSWDPFTTAIRVRQSLLEDAPMGLLDRFALLAADAQRPAAGEEVGALLQLALSALTWQDQPEVSTVLAALGEDGRGETGTVAAALAGAHSGRCDVAIDEQAGRRADAAAASLAGAVAASAAG